MRAKSNLTIVAAVALIIILVILSVGFLFHASNAYLSGHRELALYYFMVGLMGLAISAYTLTQAFFRRMKTPSSANYKVYTLMHCLKCNFRNLRLFRKGDYVLGSGEPCPKCSTPTVILAIYRESVKKV